MAKLVIRDEITYSGTIQDAWDDFKEKLKEKVKKEKVEIEKDEKNKHDVFKDAIEKLLEGTKFKRKNPPTIGVEQETDPGGDD